jgi:Protein of unknown function (DUF1579)
MSESTVDEALDALDALVGEWTMIPAFAPDPAEAPRARSTFEWLPGRRFLVQRWEVDHPDAPDGIAVIGFDPATEALVQHYFDSRGVGRRYEMALAHQVWKLQRFASEPDFSQRFTGTFSPDGNTITGHWERSVDGSSWEPDFDLAYLRLG